MTGSVELSVVVVAHLEPIPNGITSGLIVDAFPYRTDRYYSGCSTRECRALWICGFFFRLVANTPRLHATSVYGYTRNSPRPPVPKQLVKLRV